MWTVAEIVGAIRDSLEEEFATVWVEGEISNFKAYGSGHLYFTLKDEEAQLRCALFRQNARLLRFRPEDGLAVMARGRITVYAERGEMQMVIEHLQPRGVGALQLAFEQLKKKLAAEGLFDAARKRPLPAFPRRIGIVTSPSGAVIADMLRILGRRFPGLHILLYPARVQGEGAAAEICRGIEYFSRSGSADLVIVGRGGGSLEDLWAFNEESVARAIAASRAPVIAAVGHETDFTIADFVADLRAATPSAAAELAIRAKAEFVEMVAQQRERLAQLTRYRLAMTARRLGAIEARLRQRDLRVELGRRRARLQQLQAAFEPVLRLKLARAGGRLESLRAQLSHLSPLAVLERGYAIVQDESGRALRLSSETAPGRRVGIRLHQGRLGAEVTEVE